MKRETAETFGSAKDTLFNTSLEKGLRVLGAFDEGHEDLSLSQVVELTGLEKSAAQRFVRTLAKLGYLRQDPSSRRYRLSPLLFHLGTAYLRNNSLVDRAQPYMRELRRKLDVTVNLVELFKTDTIIIYRILGGEVINADLLPGARLPWHISSAGFAIVANLEEAEIEAIIGRSDLIKVGSDTITDVGRLHDRLRTTRRDGFAITHNESYDGDISVAAPIYNARGEVISAVAAAVVDTRWSIDAVRDEIAPQLAEVARAISGSVPLAGMHKRRGVSTE